MGAQERQQKEKLILEASIKLFTERGYQSTKMEDVAKASKISNFADNWLCTSRTRITERSHTEIDFDRGCYRRLLFTTHPCRHQKTLFTHIGKAK